MARVLRRLFGDGKPSERRVAWRAAADGIQRPKAARGRGLVDPAGLQARSPALEFVRRSAEPEATTIPAAAVSKWITPCYGAESARGLLVVGVLVVLALPAVLGRVAHLFKLVRHVLVVVLGVLIFRRSFMALRAAASP